MLSPLGPNQTLIYIDDVVVLFSYSTPVACRLPGQGYFRTSKYWSVTTSKHINKWMGKGGLEKPQEYFDTLLKLSVS